MSVELKFWLLVLLSPAVPMGMYLLQRRKSNAPSIFIVPFSLVLIVISGADVYLLQALASASRSTPSLLDDEIFDFALSLGLYVFPVAYGGIGLNLISAVLLAHFASIEVRDHALIDKLFTTQPHRPQPAASLSPVEPAPEMPGASARTAHKFRDHDKLKHEVGALLERLQPEAHESGAPVEELFQPRFHARARRVRHDRAHACGRRADQHVTGRWRPARQRVLKRVRARHDAICRLGRHARLSPPPLDRHAPDR